MGQEFHVLRCFTCQSFQVQQVKKANRWSCKLCGEKQSLLKEFGRGSGKDCRIHVQKLNAMRGAMMEEQEQNTWSLWEQTEEKPEELSPAHVSPAQVSPAQVSSAPVSPTQVSRWSKYLDTPEKEPEENVLMDRQHLHGNNRKRKRTEGSATPEQASLTKKGEGPMVSSWSDTTAKPRPQFPISSMFESGDDFSFDEF